MDSSPPFHYCCIRLQCTQVKIEKRETVYVATCTIMWKSNLIMEQVILFTRDTQSDVVTGFQEGGRQHTINTCNTVYSIETVQIIIYNSILYTHYIIVTSLYAYVELQYRTQRTTTYMYDAIKTISLYFQYNV